MMLLEHHFKTITVMSGPEIRKPVIPKYSLYIPKKSQKFFKIPRNFWECLGKPA